MIVLLTPSKTLDTQSVAPPYVRPTQPQFLLSAEKIRRVVRALDEASLRQYMSISASLATATKRMYEHPEIGKPALWTYSGDVYRGVVAPTLSEPAAEWAQKHVRIVSALYGLLRPYDVIDAYRLEMNASLPIDDAPTVRAFWGVALAKVVEKEANGIVLVLSSNEYAAPIVRHLSEAVRVVTPRFFDRKPNGTMGQVPIYNKQMRGVMARWMMDSRVDSLERLSDFAAHGYRYDADRSSESEPAYSRPVMQPLDLPTKAQLQKLTQ